MLVIMWTWPRPRPRLWRGSPSFSRRNPLVLVIQVLAPYALGARTHEPSQPGWRRGARESSIFSRDTAPNSQLRSQTFRCPEGIPGKATGIPVLEPTGLFIYVAWSGAREGHGRDRSRSWRQHSPRTRGDQGAIHPSRKHPLLHPPVGLL